MQSTILRLTQSLAAIVLLSVGWTQVHATELPPVQNVRIVDGDQLTWDPIEGATGYNIFLRGYLTTVRDELTFSLTEVGSYGVSAFDDNGNFSPLRGSNFAVFESGEDNRPNVTLVTTDGAYFFTRCFDVSAGESCIARCPDLVGGANGSFIIGAATGGACSSSGIDSVNAEISPDEYSCTASNFTARLEAQVACNSTPSPQ